MLPQSLDLARWNFRIGSVYHLIGDTSDESNMWKIAKDRCGAGIKANPDMWQVRSLQAQVFDRLKGYPACLATLKPIMIEDSVPMEDEQFQQIYWDVVVPLAGKCHLQLKDLESALVYFRKATDHALVGAHLPADMSIHVDQLLRIFLALGKLPEASVLLRSLSGLREDGKTWHSIMLGQKGSIHVHIVALARRCADDLDMLRRYYEDAGNTSTDPAMTLTLRFNQWRLHWYYGPHEHRDLALIQWEAMSNPTAELDADVVERDIIRMDAAREMAHAIFSKAFADGFRTAETRQHIDRLTAVNSKSESLFNDALARNPKLTIARLHHLSGNTKQAKSLLQADMRRAIRRITHERDTVTGYREIAVILAVLDDDTNARAAWCLFEPERRLDFQTNAQSEPSAANERLQILHSDSADDQAVGGAQN